MVAQPLLQVQGLRLSYLPSRKPVLQDVSFDLWPGQLVALVGESGCGKSSLVLSLARLHAHVQEEGAIIFQGHELMHRSPAQMQSLRYQGLAVLLQGTTHSLNPAFFIGRQLSEVPRLFERLRRQALQDRLSELLAAVGLEQSVLQLHPHQLSGGMRQRLLLAMALSQRPRLLIADEPSTAIDTRSERAIFATLRQQVDADCSVLLVSHDLRLVRRQAQRILVFYAGTVVEHASTESLFHAPLHPYSQSLLAAHNLRPKESVAAQPGNGQPPFAGCPFAHLCPLAQPRCRQHRPPLQSHTPNHQVRCWRAGEKAFANVI